MHLLLAGLAWTRRTGGCGYQRDLRDVGGRQACCRLTIQPPSLNIYASQLCKENARFCHVACAVEGRVGRVRADGLRARVAGVRVSARADSAVSQPKPVTMFRMPLRRSHAAMTASRGDGAVPIQTEARRSVAPGACGLHPAR
jgi:hypothetical protein